MLYRLPVFALAILLLPVAAHAKPRSLNDLAGASTKALSEESRDLYSHGHQQLRNGELDAAVEAFTQVIDQHPDFQEAYLSRAHAYRRLEQQATSVEDKDRYALRYISDEQRVTKTKSRSFIRKELDEVLTKRVLALTAIYFACWCLACYFWWYLEQSWELAWVLFAIANGVAWWIPDTPGRLPFSLGAVMFLIFVSAAKKRRGAERKFADDMVPRPTTVETATKMCPSCGRELSEIARVCPRCNQRF